MLWLKRNILLLLGILISAGALAGAVVFLVIQLKSAGEYQEQLQQQIEGYKTLKSQNPFPNDQNVQIAREESVRLRQFVTNSRPLLAVAPPPKLDSLGFKSLLENTIDELQKSAFSSGILLPSKYGFSFQALRPMVTFPTNAIEPLTVQLREVKELCGILVQGKVHSIDAIRRVRVLADEGAGLPDYLEGRTQMPVGQMTVAPYEVSFRGFSAELSAVLDALQRAQTFYVVKKIQVEKTRSVEVAALPVPGTNAPVATTTAPTPPGPKKPPGPKGTAPVAPPVPITILTEQPLRVVLSIEVVKLNKTGP
jgi:hypothetical protein